MSLTAGPPLFRTIRLLHFAARRKLIMGQPVRSLSRVIKKMTRSHEKDLSQLYNEFGDHPYYVAQTLSQAQSEDEDEDANSISSFSTNATADDLPGPGRCIDSFFYQPVGRMLERFAMKIKISNLSPALISHYIEKEFRQQRGWTWTDRPLGDVVSGIYKRQKGSEAVAGLKSLVKHAQSKNIHKAAAALTALIRVSADYDLTPFYIAVSSVEPIFQLESLAISLDDAHLEKEWLLFLASLAKTKNEVVKLSEPTIELARNLRQNLIRLLGPHQFSIDPLAVLGEACLLLAKAASCVHKGRRGYTFLHIVKTAQLSTTFILRSTLNLITCPGIAPRPQIIATISTMIHWLDTTSCRCLLLLSELRMFDVDVMRAASAFRGLVLAAEKARVFLERSCSGIKRCEIMARDTLPRRIRSIVDYNENPPIIENLVQTSMRTFGRLLHSSNELEREIRDSASTSNILTLDTGANNLDDEWSKKLLLTLYRARKVNVEKNELTEEFIEARASSRSEGKEGLGKWYEYKRACHARHNWAPYFCSNLEWDSEVTFAIKRIFKPSRKQTHSSPFRPAQSLYTPHSAPQLDLSSVETWNISTGPSQRCLPKEVRIKYTNETGETKFQTFVAAPSVKHVAFPGDFAKRTEEVTLHTPDKTSTNRLVVDTSSDEGGVPRVSEASTDEELGQDSFSCSESMLLTDTNEISCQISGPANKHLSKTLMEAEQISLYSFL